MQIDLRSDTVTKPDEGMMKAILNAKVGDDVYKEDPSVNKLEAILCDMFEMDAALFFPSGTMANQTAIKIHTQPGDQLIADHWSHIFNFEGGGASFNSGVSCSLIHGKKGMITAEQIAGHINPPDFYHSPLTSLVCLENTTNKGGGACYDLNEIRKIRKLCDQNDLGLHLDGARLWNALVAKNEDPVQYGKLFDTISVCLSKGLGAPIGSVLLGKKELMDKALRIRKILGGGMRQVGFMAKAGIYALENNLERLSEDHRRAREIAEALAQNPSISEIVYPETNIVIFSVVEDTSESEFLQALNEGNIRISSMGKNMLRIVTHLDYTEEMHQVFLNVIKEMPSPGSNS